jgi:hypothetical protein
VADDLAIHDADDAVHRLGLGGRRQLGGGVAGKDERRGRGGGEQGQAGGAESRHGAFP